MTCVARESGFILRHGPAFHKLEQVGDWARHEPKHRGLIRPRPAHDCRTEENDARRRERTSDDEHQRSQTRAIFDRCYIVAVIDLRKLEANSERSVRPSKVPRVRGWAYICAYVTKTATKPQDVVSNSFFGTPTVDEKVAR